MMTPVELCLAILVLLLTPGPTNTLLFLAGAERGALRALRLIPAEAAGYLTGVVPLMLVGATLMAWLPGARMVIGLLAAVWVAVLALQLFRLPQPGGPPQQVTARLVFVTTLLNPKALIFGLVLLPGPSAVTNLVLFIICVGLVAAAWAAAGASVSHRTSTLVPALRRVAALWLAVVAATLALRSLTA